MFAELPSAETIARMRAFCRRYTPSVYFKLFAE